MSEQVYSFRLFNLFVVNVPAHAKFEYLGSKQVSCKLGDTCLVIEGTGRVKLGEHVLYDGKDSDHIDFGCVLKALSELDRPE